MGKICCKCKETKSLDKFNKDKHTKDGFRHKCRKCDNSNRREISKKKRVDRLAQIPPGTKKCSFCLKYILIEYFGNCLSHKDGLTSYCKPCKKIKDKEYIERNRDKILAQRKEYRVDNKHKIAATNKRYNENNKDKISIQSRQHYLDNKEHIIKKNSEYKKNRIKTDVTFRIACNLRGRLHNTLFGNFKSGSAVRDLSCSIEELKQYLESKFYTHLITYEVMSWDNYGIKGWHIDHIKPLSAFDLTNRKQFLEACHYTNLQPLWAKDNLRKGAKY